MQFFAQGDRELEAGLPISPLMDRTKEGITKSQPGVRKSTGYKNSEILWGRTYRYVYAVNGVQKVPEHDRTVKLRDSSHS